MNDPQGSTRQPELPYWWIREWGEKVDIRETLGVKGQNNVTALSTYLKLCSQLLNTYPASQLMVIVSLLR